MEELIYDDCLLFSILDIPIFIGLLFKWTIKLDNDRRFSTPISLKYPGI